MKLYAQHGAMSGRKVEDGLEGSLVDGVIYSPRDIAPTQLRTALARIANDYPSADRLLDPQYYSVLLAGTGVARLGHLLDYEQEYFRSRRRSELVREHVARDDIARVLQFQESLPVTHLVSPNILIPRSLDSRETAIAVDYLGLAGQCYQAAGLRKPLLLTLAISRDALLDRTLVTDFLTEVTAIETPATGFYLLVSVGGPEVSADLYHSDVVGSWMYMNHALSVNGYSVVNGYSDLLTPWLLAAGGDAGATGWWANLRSFSLGRFTLAAPGGRQPVPRYLSAALLNRIRFDELDSLRVLLPAVLNNMGTDGLYPALVGSEPQRNQEVLQSWETIRMLIQQVGQTAGVVARVAVCRDLVGVARGYYDEIAAIGLDLDRKSGDEHLDALREGLRVFEELAELPAALE